MTVMETKQPLITSPYLKSLIAGGFAGTSVDLSLFPLDTLKTRLQSSAGFFPSGGFKNLYRGIGSVFLGSAPSAALFFITYESVKSSTFLSSNNLSTTSTVILASSLGEIAACAVRVPVEVVKQRAQATGAKSSLEALRHVVELGTTTTSPSQGHAGGGTSILGVARQLYRGWNVTIMREIPFTIIQFPLWEMLKVKVSTFRGRGQGRVTGVESALCGSVAGCVAAAATTPLDVLKTRLMLAERSQSVFTILRDIVRIEGPRALLSGIGPRMLWISAGGAVFLGAFTSVKNTLDEFVL